jgi:hypothetical protein
MPSYYVVKNGVEVEVTEAEFNAPPQDATGIPPLTKDAQESAATKDPAPKDQAAVAEVKTNKSSAGQTSTTPTTGTGNGMFNNAKQDPFMPAVEKNILHNYRSWTYNFCIGALTSEAVSDHKYLERDIKAYTVLNSAGKGNRGIGISTDGLNAKSVVYQNTKGLVDEFNVSSPGRFDMYIDNVSVDSLITAGDKKGGASIATNITFDVFEPYSMNGFIEALQVAARATGNSDYMHTPYVLRVQFQGWPDKSTNAQSTPEVVPMSTRYFPITICEVGVDVTQDGTRYKISAVPVPQMGLGAPNKLKQDIKVDGKTVGEILKNYFDAINKQVEDNTKDQTAQPGRDRYEISCPALVTVGKPQDTKAAVLNGPTPPVGTSDIIKAKMNDELSSPNVFKFGDAAKTNAGYTGASVPGSTSTNASSDPSTGKITPSIGTASFSADAQIHDCIAAIVRDSTYTRDLLKPENLDKVKAGDGLITYFTVRMEMDINGEDKVNNTKFKTYRYVLEPFLMHYTRIPGQEQGKVDMKEVKKKIKREYNYIYTGKNVDVTRFNLKFDNLYFSAIPAALGNISAFDSKSKSSAPDGTLDAKRTGSNAVEDTIKNPKINDAPTAVVMTDPEANSFRPEAKAGQVQGDPYALLAQSLHDAVLNKVDMIQGTLEILGDPYYLVTGGMGNADLNLKEPMLTSDGQAPTTQGAVYVNVNFRNPIDINSKTGLLDFGSSPISFSGVYQILSLKNNFKDGQFTQALEIMRVPGQILGKEEPIAAPSGKTSQLPGQQLIKDTKAADILASGIRPSDFNLANLLSRGLPSVGLPGNVSNFTNSLIGAAGLTGVTGSVSGLLQQVSGVAGAANNITNQLGVNPLGGVNALTSGIRLSASGLGSVTSLPGISSAAASITAAGASIGNLAGVVNAPTQLASQVASSIAALPSATISAVSGLASGAASQASSLVQNVSGLATAGFNKVSGLVGDAKNSIASLQNTMPTDFSSVGSKLGIDTSALAGLSPDLASKMTTELADVAKNIPANTDLGGLKEQGISFANITKDKLGNLPALQPKDIAPPALLDPALASIAAQSGDVNSLLGGKANLPNLTNINNVTNPLGTVSAGLSGGFGTAQSAFGSVSAANSLVNNTIGSAVGIANNVGSLAQNSIQGFSPSSIGLGSVESNLNNVTNLVQAPTQAVNNLGISVANQFGSRQSSPLAKLVNNSNIQGTV